MLQTFEALTDEHGHIQLLESVTLPIGWRVLITLLSEPAGKITETALLSETALASEWNNSDEDEAWSHLQSARSS